MQISPVSGGPAPHAAPATHVAHPSSSKQQADTVHLSSAARAQVSGDADHDGDSH